MTTYNFDKNNPQKWLQETRKLFKLWMYKAEVGGGTTKFQDQIAFQIPKSKTSNENTTIPIQSKINYSVDNLNNIYKMISASVRTYIKS